MGSGRGCFPNNNPSGLSRIASNNPSTLLTCTPSHRTPAKPRTNLLCAFKSLISTSTEVFKPSAFLNTRSNFSVQHRPRELDPSNPSLGSREVDRRNRDQELGFVHTRWEPRGQNAALTLAIDPRYMTQWKLEPSPAHFATTHSASLHEAWP